MPARSIQGRFLLRGSGLLILLLILWWFLLLNPLLFLLRESVTVIGSALLGANSQDFVSETESRDWSFRVPLDVVVPKTAESAGPTHLSSIEFDIARPDLIAFTFSLPVFWAILLAAPAVRSHWRPMILGTILIAILEVVLLTAFVEISAQNVAIQLSGKGSEVERWWLRVGTYLVVNVIPFVAPFAAAILLHRELRWQLLRWGDDVRAQKPAASRILQPDSVVKRSR